MILSIFMSVAVIVSPVVQIPHSHDYRVAHSEAAQDWKGFEPSLYEGKWFDPKDEKIRECISFRESRHNYRGTNSSSSAEGNYQFLDNSWRDSLTYMMVEESRKNGDGLVKQIRELRNEPIRKWNRYFQDRAFWTAWRFGAGAKHWFETIPSGRC